MCKAFARVIIIVLNIVFVPLGLSLIVVGGFMKWGTNTALTSLKEDLEKSGEAGEDLINAVFAFMGTFGLVLFFQGLFFTIMAFSGIYGACCKSKILLGVYAVLLGLVFLALLIFVIVLGVKTNELKQRGAAMLLELLTNDYVLNNEKQIDEGTNILMDPMQRNRQCCGIYDGRDYERVKNRVSTDRVPDSCCIQRGDRSCWQNPTAENSYFNRGCFSVITETVKPYFLYALFGMIGVLVFTLFVLVLSIYLIVRFVRDEIDTV